MQAGEGPGGRERDGEGREGGGDGRGGGDQVGLPRFGQVAQELERDVVVVGAVPLGFVLGREQGLPVVRELCERVTRLFGEFQGEEVVHNGSPAMKSGM